MSQRAGKTRGYALWGAVFLVLAGEIIGARAHDLQPFEMVYPLQRLQDRIAGGDHTALPLQRKLLKQMDIRLREAEQGEFEDKRNVEALMVYSMSGGNPSTIARLLAHIHLSEMDRKAGTAILSYLQGETAKTRDAMLSIDPKLYSSRIAPFLSLIKGSVIGIEHAAEGIAILDDARLESPGTLIEEAALRRTIVLAITAGNTGKFLSASEQYSRRFLHSPYASRFARSFVSGILQFRAKNMNLNAIEAVTEWMADEQAQTIYLRLARQAAIEGDNALLTFASDHTGGQQENDPRSELYFNISQVTSSAVRDVLARLQKLDATKLSMKDRALLDTAKMVASKVIAPVDIHELETRNENTKIDAPVEIDALVSGTRSRLEAIDTMLGNTDQ